jgi:hydroxymethylpyrimidine pyrophosphatase-like HAD family hydrolase
VYQSGGTRIEITAKNVSKGEALKHISRDYNLIIAIGDSGNDISMFKEASLSFCMSHAPENVKKHASYVVDSFKDAVECLCELLTKSNRQLALSYK